MCFVNIFINFKFLDGSLDRMFVDGMVLIVCYLVWVVLFFWWLLVVIVILWFVDMSYVSINDVEFVIVMIFVFIGIRYYIMMY